MDSHATHDLTIYINQNMSEFDEATFFCKGTIYKPMVMEILLNGGQYSMLTNDTAFANKHFEFTQYTREKGHFFCTHDLTSPDDNGLAVYEWTIHQPHCELENFYRMHNIYSGITVCKINHDRARLCAFVIEKKNAGCSQYFLAMKSQFVKSAYKIMTNPKVIKLISSYKGPLAAFGGGVYFGPRNNSPDDTQFHHKKILEMAELAECGTKDLTDSERKVYILKRQRYSIKDIARKLEMSTDVVVMHLKNIRKKGVLV